MEWPFSMAAGEQPMMKTRKVMVCASAVVIAALFPPASLRAQNVPFFEQWNAATSTWFILLSPGQCRATSNVANTGAMDGKALQLMVAANAPAGAGRGPEVETKTLYLYGTYSARLKTVDCTGQPDAGIVTGLFTYFNDGTDRNGDGLPDNSEIDFEWLGAEPQTVYLTMWTDYRDSDAKHKRVARKINLSTGTIEYCYYAESFGGTTVPLTGLENQPATVQAIAGYNSAMAYYEYAFTWSPSRVTWWLVTPDSGKKIVLWDYQGNAARIPARSAYCMINAWHTNNWTPDSRPTAILPPSSPVSAFVDWARFDTSSSAGVRHCPQAVLPAGRRSQAAAIFDCKGRKFTPLRGGAASPAGIYLIPSADAGGTVIKNCRLKTF